MEQRGETPLDLGSMCLFVDFIYIDLLSCQCIVESLCMFDKLTKAKTRQLSSNTCSHACKGVLKQVIQAILSSRIRDQLFRIITTCD